MKKLIIHLTGTICSGKSTIINYLWKENINSDIISAWDIAEWYEDNNIIINNEFIFDNYMLKRHKLWKDFRRFAARNPKSMIYILESSGSNQEINKHFNQTTKENNINTLVIKMKSPSIKEIKERAKQREDITVEKALDMLELYNKTRIPEEELTFEETYFYIKEWIKYYEQ